MSDNNDQRQMGQAMNVSRTSRLYRTVRRIDSFLYVFLGYIPDFRQLDFVHERRELFTKEGLIKQELSLIPFTDRALKSAVKELGGWQWIMSEDFKPTEEVYKKLEAAGFAREKYEKSRAYLKDPTGYRRRALDERRR